MSKSINFKIECVVPLALQQAWDVFSDTDHFNRFVALPQVLQVGLSPVPKSFERLARAKLGAINLSWRELPFDWVEAQYFSVRRLYSSGPAVEISSGVEFTGKGPETLLRFVVAITPRSNWVVPLIKAIAWRVTRNFRTYCEEFTAGLQRGKMIIGPVRGDVVVDLNFLDSGLLRAQALTEAPATLVANLTEHLVFGGDDEVLHMRPYSLADRWGQDRHQTLALFLHAAKAGVLDLEWQLMCPYCRVPKAETKTPFELGQSYHCDLCGIIYDRDIERYTEVRFSANSRVRKVEDVVFCLGSPSRTPHVAVQAFLGPKSTREVRLQLGGEACRLRAVGSNAVVNLLEQGERAAKQLTMQYSGSGWGIEHLDYAAGAVTMTLRNDSDAAALFVIERTRWHRDAITAAELLLVQEFRDLFGSARTGASEPLAEQQLTVVRTGLAGVSEYYRKLGNAVAYRRIEHHLTYLSQIVARHHGLMVRSGTQAITGVFVTPAAALRAALAMQQEFAAFNLRISPELPMQLQVGIAMGSTIAVRAGDAVDYCGATVELAADLANLCGLGEVVVAKALFADKSCAEIGRPLQIEPSHDHSGSAEAIRLSADRHPEMRVPVVNAGRGTASGS